MKPAQPPAVLSFDASLFDSVTMFPEPFATEPSCLVCPFLFDSVTMFPEPFLAFATEPPFLVCHFLFFCHRSSLCSAPSLAYQRFLFRHHSCDAWSFMLDFRDYSRALNPSREGSVVIGLTPVTLVSHMVLYYRDLPTSVGSHPFSWSFSLFVLLLVSVIILELLFKSCFYGYLFS